jgi:hypothetical protein
MSGMAKVEMPEPLATALKTIAEWMFAEHLETLTAAKGCSVEDYAQLLEENAGRVLPFLRQELERRSRGKVSVREVARAAISMSDPENRYFATCMPDVADEMVIDLELPGLVGLYCLATEPLAPTAGIVAIHMGM